MLYLIEILHQTTTTPSASGPSGCCILLKFYIKPQQPFAFVEIGRSCILLKFYIKPQPRAHHLMKRMVVSYWNSTSNHNGVRELHPGVRLYLIEILHQTTTEAFARGYVAQLYLIEILHQTTTADGIHDDVRSCILLKFYIKPQL